MADEGFEAYHVPQQSRRDKLREQLIVAQNQPLLQPFYDSSLMNISSSSSSNSSSLSLSHSHHAYFDPNGFSIPNSNQGNSTIQVFGNNPFLYQPQNVQNLHQNMVFKPEALSLSLSSHRSMIPFQGLVVGGGTSGSVPFTGYASVLKDSRFLKAAMELLEEMCDVGVSGICGEKVMVVADASLMEPPLERSLSEDPVVGDGGEGRNNKSRLLNMLDEVYRRYRHYYQQMQAVVTSFEYVSGLNNAAPYASLAIKSMSKHFRCLKKAITDQIQFINKATHFHISNRKDGSPRFGNNERVGPYSQQQQPVWRPQRGLPDRAVTVLRAWLFEHFLHPYPTDTDKIMLAKQTGLSRSQVSNWFINARVRVWKPMVEEIHTLETKQAPNNEHSKNKSSDHFPSETSLVSENPSTSTNKFQNSTYKQAMNEQLPNIPIRSPQQQQQQLNLPPPGGVGMNIGGASSNNNSNNNNNSVSLTLGLYQNHGIGLAEQPFPLSAAQRFGLGLETTNNEGYVMSGFESQNRHFGRDVNIGGQMFHDFVG